MQHLYDLMSGLMPALILMLIFGCSLVLKAARAERRDNAAIRPRVDWAKVYEIEREIWQQTFYHDGAPSPEEVAKRPDPVMLSALAASIAAVTSASPVPAAFTSIPTSAAARQFEHYCNWCRHHWTSMHRISRCPACHGPQELEWTAPPTTMRASMALSTVTPSSDHGRMISQFRELRRLVWEDCKALHAGSEGRAFTAEEMQRWDSLQALLSRLDERIKYELGREDGRKAIKRIGLEADR